MAYSLLYLLGGEMPTVLINPLDERTRERGRSAARLDSISGKKLALLDISKPGGKQFLDRLGALLEERYDGVEIVRLVKPTFTRPAPEEIIRRIIGSGAQGVIEALAD